MRFKPGQKVVCIKEDQWKSLETGLTFNGPKYGEIVTVKCKCPDWPDNIILYEYERLASGRGISFQERRFEPLMDISELTEVLTQESITV